MTAYFFEIFEEALELVEAMLINEPGQYYLRAI
jgi:hypothetical protein